MRPKYIVNIYQAISSFQDGVNAQFAEGYNLLSWNTNEDEIVAVFESIEVSVELTSKIIEESMKQVGKS